MLENLINLVRENAGDAIINNPAIPNERNEEAVQDTSNSIVSSLQNAGNIIFPTDRTHEGMKPWPHRITIKLTQQ